jgi:HEAT repeat protein
MSAKFDDLLGALRDATRPLPIDRLPELSDLDTERIARLRSAWPEIADERRLALIEALGQLGDDQIEFTFERVHRMAMDDPLPEIRAEAIRNLWECEDPSLVAPLLTTLDRDPSAEVRAASSSALGAFLFLGETGSLPADLLPRIEEGLLRACAADPEDAVRRLALESLGYSSREDVAPLIERAYASADDSWKRSSLVAMGRSVNKAWTPDVTRELTSAIPALRLEAARAAGELDLQDTVPALIDLLDDVDDEIRHAAIWSLGQLGGEAAQAALVRLLDRSDDEDETELLEDALGNLAFVDGTRDFLIFDFDEPEDEGT